jgi:predicted component of type VI protein secretion system
MHLSQQSLILLEAIITETLVDEPSSYFVELMAESIKDFEPVEHVPNYRRSCA